MSDRPPIERLVQLSTLPRETWLGREVWHPFSQVGDQAHWRAADEPESYREAGLTDKELLEWSYDRGTVVRYVSALKFYGEGWIGWRVFFKADPDDGLRWGGLQYDACNLWTEETP